MHVAVLGGGVIGVAAAYFLGADGHDVTVIDGAREVGADASAGNAGFLAPNDAFSWASPAVPAAVARSLLGEPTGLRVRFGLDPERILWGARFLRECTSARAYRASVAQMRLSRYSQVIQQEIERAEDIDYSLVRRGSFYLYRDARRLAEAARRSDLFREHGIEQRRMSMAEVTDLEPALDAARSHFAGAIYGVSDASGDCATFTRALAGRCVDRYGARLVLDTQIRGLVGDPDRIRAAHTTAGDIEADVFVLALGVGSARIARSLGIRLPIYPVKGYSATFPVRDPDRVPTMPAVEQSTLIAWSRFGDRMRMSSTAEVAGYDRTWKPANFTSIRDLARDVLPGVDLDHGSYRACLRPMTPDGPPILGVGRHRNLVYNTGHGHLGWTMACGSGRVTADLVAGARPAVDLTGMQPRSWRT
jgi:D-amino-acid dehydrogenase